MQISLSDSELSDVVNRMKAYGWEDEDPEVMKTAAMLWIGDVVNEICEDAFWYADNPNSNIRINWQKSLAKSKAGIR